MLHQHPQRCVGCPHVVFYPVHRHLLTRRAPSLRPHTPTADKERQTALEAALKADKATLAPPTTVGNITYDPNITDSGASGFTPARAFTLILPGLASLASC